MLAISLVLGVIKFSLLFVGMNVGAPAGLASLVLQVQAFFTLILATLLLKERPNGAQIGGMLLAFSGIGLIALTVDNQATPLGLLLVIGAALAWACSNLLMKKVGQVDMLHLMVHVSLVAALPLFLMSLIFEGWAADRAALASLSWTGVGAVLYVAFGAMIFGFAVWDKLIRTYGAGKIAPFSLLVPIFGMISSALILGEELGPPRIVAAALVIAGLVLTVVRLPLGRRGVRPAPHEANSAPS